MQPLRTEQIFRDEDLDFTVLPGGPISEDALLPVELLDQAIRNAGKS